MRMHANSTAHSTAPCLLPLLPLHPLPGSPLSRLFPRLAAPCPASASPSLALVFPLPLPLFASPPLLCTTSPCSPPAVIATPQPSTMPPLCHRLAPRATVTSLLRRAHHPSSSPPPPWVLPFAQEEYAPYAYVVACILNDHKALPPGGYYSNHNMSEAVDEVCPPPAVSSISLLPPPPPVPPSVCQTRCNCARPGVGLGVGVGDLWTCPRVHVHG